MKITVLLVAFSFCQLHAYTFYGQKNKVSISIEKATVKQIFNEIERQTDYTFFYNSDDVDTNRNISINLKQQPLEKVLDVIFKESTDISYKIMGTHIIVTKKSFYAKMMVQLFGKQDPPVYQQNINGIVTDVSGYAFPGVYIVNVNTSKGVVTDMEGKFSISATVNDTLSISHIGFVTQHIVIGEQSILNIVLEEDTEELSEVVVTGMFERKSESFTGSTVTVGKEELRKVGNLNVFQAIQNIDPSIILVDNFGAGSNPNNIPDIQIRGTSTFPGQSETDGLKGNYLKSPNQPLFILNGFEASAERIFDLDFNRIERLTILKDAASKAMYGSRAANGVIVIETTKLSDDEVRITYNVNVDIELPDLDSYNLTNSIEKLQAEQLDGMYLSGDPDTYVQLQQLYNSRLTLAQKGLDTDWMAKPLRNGIGQRHALGVELGGDNLRLLADLNYRKLEGVMKGSGRENIGGSLTAFYRVKNVNFKNITTVNNNEATESPYGEFSEYVQMNPYWRATNIDGSIPYYSEIGPNGERYTNPLYNSTLSSVNTSNYFNFINNFYIEWQISPALKAIGRVGVDIKKSKADEFYPASHTMFEFYSSEDEDRKGSYQVNNGSSNYLYTDINLQYSKLIGKHHIFSNLGFNLSDRDFEETMVVAEGFPSSRMQDISFANGYELDGRPTAISGTSRDLGFLAVGSYVYDNRFLSDVTFRTSASSQFGDDKRWSNFWSVGLGWNIHNESFLKNGIFDQLKIRGSIGSTGNQNFNSNESIVTYGYYLNSRYQDHVGSYVLNMGNPGLQWETKFDLDTGLDVKIGGLTLRYDYYESTTENLITDISLSYTTGFDSVKDNLGKVRNRGVEVNASYLVWSQDRNYISLNAGISTNENKIVELSDAMQSFNDLQDELAADDENNTPVHRYEDGMSMDAIWGVPSLGIDPSNGKEIYVKRDGSTTYDWDANDQVVIGNSNPKYRGLFGISGEFEGFGFSVMARYLGGGQLYNQTLVDRVENVDMNYNVDKRVLTGRWQQPGDNTLFKGLGYYNESNVFQRYTELTRPTSRFVQDRNELDLASISAYYDFTHGVTSFLGIDRLRFSFNMNNVAQFSTIRIERGTSYPFSRTMSFSLMANF
ncbi:SusC/RagA family TonB-linked outer membrane protein [Robertkochia solimangrovi]|uniref:SusC/RagA family TonB-linked outer membrane protein n=1 Tax=Robertkochia solimangrovi TaxID=2213046 RepID=UPI0011815B39|nr:SusC/RagA family TonB-linked outer membrane protein [Robertkochia solimangrovi]TRZ45434.1 SusC/RagA family TonB-linked outer membrane protein [Robertkochia solimangrovi]